LQPKEVREKFSEKKLERGDTSAKATLRLFDAPDSTIPRITFWRDSASWCPYCQLIWIQLEEKRIPYKIEANLTHCCLMA